MKRFKITIHIGQVNTFLIEEYETKEECQDHWEAKVNKSRDIDELMRIGDVLVNAKMITFVVVEELVLADAEPTAGATIEV